MKNDGAVSKSKSRPFIRVYFPIYQTQPYRSKLYNLDTWKSHSIDKDFSPTPAELLDWQRKKRSESIAQSLLKHPNRQIMTKMANNWSQLKTCETKCIVRYSYCHAACHGRLLRHGALWSVPDNLDAKVLCFCYCLPLPRLVRNAKQRKEPL